MDNAEDMQDAQKGKGEGRTTLQYATPVKARWSKAGIWSLVTSCGSALTLLVPIFLPSAWLCVFGPPVFGIMFGVESIVEIGRSKGRVRGAGFAIGGMTVGVLWLAFWIWNLFFVHL